jgi:hypothetical protein
MKAGILLIGLSILMLLSVEAFAGRSKLRKSPGITEGDRGNTETASMPIGLPIQANKPTPSINDGAAQGSVASGKIVYAFELSEEDGISAVQQTKSAFRQARNMGASCVLIKMKNNELYDGAADYIRQEIMDYDKPVMLYYEDDSEAANTLSKVCDSVYQGKNSRRVNTSKQVIASKNSSAPTIPAAPNIYSRHSDRSVEQEIAKAKILSGDFENVLHEAGMSDYEVVVHQKTGLDRILHAMGGAIGFSMLSGLFFFWLLMQSKTRKLGFSTVVLLFTTALVFIVSYSLELLQITDAFVLLLGALLIFMNPQKVSIRVAGSLLTIAGICLLHTDHLIWSNFNWNEVGHTMLGIVITCALVGVVLTKISLVKRTSSPTFS